MAAAFKVTWAQLRTILSIIVVVGGTAFSVALQIFDYVDAQNTAIALLQEGHWTTDDRIELAERLRSLEMELEVLRNNDED